MLTIRQKKIIKILFDVLTTHQIVTSTQLAADCGVTTKTIQTDIRAINRKIISDGMQIISVPGRGYQMNISDGKSMGSLISSITEPAHNANLFANKTERHHYVIGTLLFSHKPILSDFLANSTFVSRSQFSLDIKEIKQILKKYSLTLRSSGRSGLMIEGVELNKRRCLAGELIDCRRYTPQNPGISRNDLRDIVFDALSMEQYAISDLDIQNLILYVDVTAYRIAGGYSLTDYDFDENALSIEFSIAQQIHDELKSRFHLQVDPNEVAYLATILWSMRIPSDRNMITDDMESLVSDIFQVIEHQFGIDLSNDMELRINLALHLTSLLERASNSLLSTNQMLPVIKQTLPLAFDIGVVVCHFLENKRHILLNEDEAGFLALHFDLAQRNLPIARNKVNVLIITSSRKSESILLRYNFQKHFGNDISDLDIVQVSELSQLDTTKYHLVLTTSHSTQCSPPSPLKDRAIKINYFLEGEDIALISAELLKLSSRETVFQFFHPALFWGGIDPADQADLLSMMCDEMQALFPCEADLYRSVMAREQYGSSVFANHIAIPHPDRLIALDTAIAVAILKRPIPWGNSLAQVVFLISVKKNNEGEMARIYGILSKLIQNKLLIRELTETPTFNNLIRVIKSCDSTSARQRAQS